MSSRLAAAIAAIASGQAAAALSEKKRIASLMIGPAGAVNAPVGRGCSQAAVYQNFGLFGYARGNETEGEPMGVENFAQAGTGSKRGAKRARVLLVARIETETGAIEARLRDLSRKGALLECKQIPARGSEVVFSRGETRVPARVAWANDGRIGLEFHRQIDEQELLVHVGTAANGAEDINARYRRPGFGHGLSAEDRRAAQSWSVAVGINLPERKD